MTARELIRRAMRSLGVLHTSENPSADESSDALETLNDMLNAWRLEGIDLEFIADLTLNSEIPYPDDHIAAFRYNLAMELAPEFGVQPSPVLAIRADSTLRALRAEYTKPAILSTDEALHPVFNPNYEEGYYKEFL